MACKDDRIFQFENGQGAATYKLKVSGPTGAFSATARFDDCDTPPEQSWPSTEIEAPAEKLQALEGANAYVVSVTVKCTATKKQKIKVAASVDDESYCREIACVADEFERIVHFIKRT
ncbi:MAG TPA: hypothetical protein VMZ90_14260 [Vicinamibacterales bacterium]|nr:hypothetical protein [Vicinamibacterales bacterium]